LARRPDGAAEGNRLAVNAQREPSFWQLSILTDSGRFRFQARLTIDGVWVVKMSIVIPAHTCQN